MIIILENIGDICEENPFKKPDKKPENPPSTISELPKLHCYNICKMNAHHLNRFTCKKLVMYWRIFYAVDAKKVLYRCYLAVEQFGNRKKETIYDQPPLEKANLKFEPVFNIHAYV